MFCIFAAQLTIITVSNLLTTENVPAVSGAQSMKTRIYISANFIYAVSESGNEERPLIVTRPYKRGPQNSWAATGEEKFRDAGMFINQQGGPEALLAKCEEVNDLEAWVAELNTKAKADHEKARAAAIEREAEEKAEAKAEYDKVFANEVTETNAKSVYTLLRYLNTQNCGVWKLPKMTIGYECHQYDCDGKIATTIKLDKPIRVAGEEGTWFQYGAPHRHLMKYRRIFDSEE